MIGAPFAHALGAVSEARLRARVRLSTVWLSGALLLGGLALGMLVSTQWQTRAAAGAAATSPITRQSDREIVASTISRLEDDQARLKNQIAGLRSQLNSVQGTDGKRKSALRDINSDISQQRMASGMVALTGAGVVATFDDSTARSIPENEDPANYILHEYDLRDVLNTLWIAGAEALSVNGERVVSSTSIYCVGTTIIANSTRLSPPYEVRAIGDPQALTAALKGSPQMEKFNQRAQIYDLPVKIDQQQSVQVPAYNGSFVFKFAQVQGQQ
jgi:uncharacterized protein YlxW (UPF0749 family)